MATDDDLNPTSYERFTPTSKPGIHPLVYIDMRGNAWVATWDLSAESWSIAPVKDTYGEKAGKLSLFGETPSVLIDGVENMAERYRIATKPVTTATGTPSPGNSGDGGALLLLLLLLAALDSK